MHNCVPPNCAPPDLGCCIAKGDAWLRTHLDAYLRRARTHNSLLILIFDESDDLTGYAGLTHVNLLRTLEAMYGLPRAGAQQPNAAAWGISGGTIITDIFQP